MMRIAVIFESALHAGGGFQQELSTACLLKKHQGAHEIFFYTTIQENVLVLKGYGIKAEHLDTSSIYHKFCAGLSCWGKLIQSRFLLSRKTPFEARLIKDGIDLVYFLLPSRLALLLTSLNYVLTVWDQDHRDNPEFPEVNFNGEFVRREDFFRNALPRAVAVLVSSELGKANLVRRYGCDASRVWTAPFLPSFAIALGALIDVKKKYGIHEKYVYYPAQLWPHKNHVYIIDGLKILRERFGVDMDVVLSGSDKGHLKVILDYARKSGMEKNVHYVGFVPNEDMASFYKQAVALVMPTYLGLTNIPPLEAFALGCPVCYTDLPGFRDQVEDAAFLLNLDDPASMAGHLMTILNKPDVVLDKVNKGKAVLSRWTVDDYGLVLKEIFDKYERKMKCWKGVCSINRIES